LSRGGWPGSDDTAGRPSAGPILAAKPRDCPPLPGAGPARPWAGVVMDFERFLQQACPPLDLEWRKYRRRSARHAVDSRIRELRLAGYAAYLELLARDPREQALLPGLMRVTVSRFFREHERWWTLRDRVLPQLVSTTPGRVFRVWSIGACGGEEAYSLSLLWSGLAPTVTGEHALEVTATDIDPSVLARARRRLYSASSLREVPEEVRARWFVRESDDPWLLGAEAAAPVRFRRHDFMTEQAPAEFDLVLCRYLAFTYYRGRRRAEALRRLAAALRPAGALMIGAKESLRPDELEFFEPWQGAEGAYRRRVV
jgi:chemotaxis protein methyltransferase CheR